MTNLVKVTPTLTAQVQYVGGTSVLKIMIGGRVAVATATYGGPRYSQGDALADFRRNHRLPKWAKLGGYATAQQLGLVA